MYYIFRYYLASKKVENTPPPPKKKKKKKKKKVEDSANFKIEVINTRTLFLNYHWVGIIRKNVNTSPSKSSTFFFFFFFLGGGGKGYFQLFLDAK